MRERMQRLSAVGIPNLTVRSVSATAHTLQDAYISNARREIRTARRRARPIGAEFGAPNRAFVSDKGADPIAGPFAQHWVPVLAAGYEQVRSIVQKR